MPPLYIAFDHPTYQKLLSNCTTTPKLHHPDSPISPPQDKVNREPDLKQQLFPEDKAHKQSHITAPLSAARSDYKREQNVHAQLNSIRRNSN